VLQQMVGECEAGSFCTFSIDDRETGCKRKSAHFRRLRLGGRVVPSRKRPNAVQTAAAGSCQKGLMM